MKKVFALIRRTININEKFCYKNGKAVIFIFICLQILEVIKEHPEVRHTVAELVRKIYAVSISTFFSGIAKYSQVLTSQRGLSNGQTFLEPS